ncbi:MAG: S41 family peptidase [Candidatus Krumholzibacteriota bacterium]|nr:S41 family peptidase [Candidatus Krumholzibacteriota bacterium]
MKLNKKIILVVALFSVLATGAFYVWAQGQEQRQENAYQELERFNDVLNKILNYYVDEKSVGELIDAAIEGMLKELDPHSVYLSKHQYDNLMIDTKGEFGGLGITISVRDNYPTVISPIEDTPAYRLGMQGGDQIIAIEGESTKGWSSDQAVAKLRGRPGTQVNITVGREGMADSLLFTITREIIRVPSVTYYDVIEGVGYVRIARFAEQTARDLDGILDDFENQGVQGVILDLRGNPGGLLSAAWDVSNLFLDKGKKIVYTECRLPGYSQEFIADGRKVHKGYPVVILVNGASASASEILAGALQDWDRAIIAGQTTFGKGSVQTVFKVGEEDALKLTTQKYFTPTGRSIHKDIEREPGEIAAAEEKDIERQEYHTAGGRIVYGGGGILPDWKFEYPKYTDFQRKMDINSIFFTFAVNYTAYHEVDETFTVTDEVFSEFQDFMKSKEIEFTADEWTEENTKYAKRGIKREVFRKLYGTRGAYLAVLPVDEELQKVLEMFRNNRTLEEMFSYIEAIKAREKVAKTENK